MKNNNDVYDYYTYELGLAWLDYFIMPTKCRGRRRKKNSSHQSLKHFLYYISLETIDNR